MLCSFRWGVLATGAWLGVEKADGEQCSCLICNKARSYLDMCTIATSTSGLAVLATSTSALAVLASYKYLSAPCPCRIFFITGSLSSSFPYTVHRKYHGHRVRTRSGQHGLWPHALATTATVQCSPYLQDRCS
jgi:hypothetical protein